VQSIRDAALVFRISEYEAQVVERIVEGLTPTQCARFVFQAPPSTFLQLEQLAIVDRNIAYAIRRETFNPPVTVSAVKSQPKAWNSRHSHAQSPTT
jgi:hypothetical protein